MSDHPLWPTYLVAPPDSIYALGIVSINYARFEYAVTWMLSSVGEIPEDFARMVQAKSGMQAALQLLSQMTERRERGDDAAPRVAHFVKAANILTANRNALVHANMAHGQDRTTTVYRVNRKGLLIQFDARLEDIRRVADDLERYFNFGHALANALAVHVFKKAELIGLIGHAPWPDIPPLPIPFLKEDR